MNKKIIIGVVAALVILLGVTGFVVYKTLFGQAKPAVVQQDEVVDIEPQVASSIIVDAKKSTKADNTVVISVSGMAEKMSTVGYELTYDSKGLIKGVNSGGKPLDVTGKDTFERDVYMGTCSRNVCTPDGGVTKVSVALEFTDTQGKKSQFSKDFEL